MIALLVTFALAAGTPAQASGAEASAQHMAAPAKLGLCVACHGSDGRSRMPSAPHIGGQTEAYLIWALTQYREGRREGDVMNSVIGVLNRRDIEALARWYANQTWPALDPGEAASAGETTP